jgi:hypothetical protein
LVIALILPFVYFLAVTLPSLFDEIAIAERYYRPVLPLLLILSAVGWYQICKDIPRRFIVGVLLLVLVGGNVFYILRGPIREHRAPQTKAGEWLREYDPEYRGYVWSDYSQPVYYAGMEYLPAESINWIRGKMPDGGMGVKYAIIEPDIIEVEDKGDKGKGLTNIKVATGQEQINHKWQQIEYGTEFTNPPVVLSSVPTFHGGEAGIVSIQKVGREKCNICFQECDYLDGAHVREDICWLALQPGSWTEGGHNLLEVKALKITANKQAAPKRITFAKSFKDKPVVFTQVQTVNNDYPVQVRITEVDRHGFSVFLQAEEALEVKKPEEVGYLAVDPQVSKSGEVDCEIGLCTADLGEGKTIGIGDQKVGLRFQEEQSCDKEVAHCRETIGVMSIADGPNLLSQIETTNEEDFVILRLLPQGGTHVESYIKGNHWKLIYRESDRGIRIYQSNCSQTFGQ